MLWRHVTIRALEAAFAAVSELAAAGKPSILVPFPFPGVPQAQAGMAGLAPPVGTPREGRASFQALIRRLCPADDPAIRRDRNRV